MVIALIFLGMAAFPVSGWMFRADPMHSGVYDDGGIRPNGELRWNFTTGDRVSSSPTVSNGVVYVGSYDTKVYAINAETGSKIWDFMTGGSVYSSPAVANGVVYVGSRDNKIYAINATTGTKIWDYAAGGSVCSSPAVANGVVYVGSNDNKVYAINATTGTKIWDYTAGDYVYSAPAVANGVVYVGSDDNKVYAINATTGTKIWDYTTGGWVDSSPAVANGVVYVGSRDSRIYALNALTGTKIWEYTTGDWVDSSPAVANGVLYVGSWDKKVYAINATTGMKIWEYTTGDWVDSSPAVANGVLYVGSGDYMIYAINATTGTKIWDYTTAHYVTSSPAVANGVLYVGSWDNKVFAIGTAVPSLTITSVSPASGINTGNQNVFIAGNKFQTGAIVNLTNGSISIPGTTTTSNNTTIRCTFPMNGAPPWVYNLNIRNPDGQTASLQNAFTVTNVSPVITTITPSSGFNTSSLQVTITGTAFRNGATVLLVNESTNIPGSITNRTTTKILATFPLAGITPGMYNLTILNIDGTSGTKQNIFTVLSPRSYPTITGFNPTSGVNTAPLTITITGTNFRPSPTVIISDNTTSRTISGTVTGNTSIKSSLPLTGLPIGMYNLTIRNTDGTSVTRENEFNVTNPVPTISTITPSSGYTSGPVTITITGSRFVSGAGISLDNTTSSVPGVVTSFSATRITGTFALSILSSGTYNLTVTNPGGPNTTKPFTVFLPGSGPTITGFTPTSGVNTAPLSITITGTNFRPNPTITVTITNNTTSRTVTGTVTGNTTIRCSLPLTRLPIGRYNLTVRNTDGSTVTRENGFNVINPKPSISTISPSSGYTTGPVTVTISGSRFVSGAEISLENTTSNLSGVLTSFSATRITGTFALQTLSTGTYNLTVTNPGGPNATKPFTVFSPGSDPTISVVNPTSGVNTAPLSITITGTNFKPTPTVIITNNTTSRSVTGTVTGNTTIRCSLPLTGLPIGTYNLTVRNSDGSSVTRENEFNITNPTPFISTITPSSGYTAGSVTITISGSKFVSGAEIALQNATSGLSGVVISFSATRITGTFALHTISNGTYNLTVTNPGGPNMTKPFTVLSPGSGPTITGFTPNSGVNTAPLSIIITGTNFRPTPTIIITNNTTIRTITGTVTGNTTVKCSLPLSGLPIGKYNLTVRNTDGSSSTRENELTVSNPIPFIASVTPTSGYSSGSVVTTISGSKFVSGAMISLENTSSRLPGAVTSFSATRITGTFALNKLSNGTYNLTVSNPGDANGTKVNAFTVLVHGTAPVISMINPASGFNNANLPVTITGMNFRTPSVYLSQGSLIKPATAGKNQTATTLSFTLPLAGIPGGLYTIMVRNSDGMVVNATDIFYVTDMAWISKTLKTGERPPVVQNQGIPVTGIQSHSPRIVGPSNRQIISR